MNLKRKVLWLVIVMIITMCGNIITVSAAFSAPDRFELLSSLGFFDESKTYDENEQVKRLDVVTALINSLPENKKMKYNNGDTGFSDVSSSVAYASIAYQAKTLGILGKETEFRAYDNASVEDAYMMILNLLGYGVVLENGYSNIASFAGLDKSVSNSDILTMKQFVTILYNALEANVMKFDYNVSYENYMTDILEAGTGKGIIYANNYTGISGYSAVGDSQVIIGGERYYIGKTDANIRIGEQVEFYYKIDSDENKTLVYVKSREDRVLQLDARIIDDFSDMTYFYRAGDTLNRVKKATVLRSADVIYNGKLITGELNRYVPDAGSVKLIDNNGDNKYETVVITDYEVVVVDSVDKKNGIIRNLYYPEKSYSIDLYQEDTYMVLNQEREIKKFSDIYKYDTIFVAQSYDKQVSEIIISDKRVKGTVTSYSSNYVAIDDVEYEITEDVQKFETVGIHSYGIFHLDPYGRIGYFEGHVSSDIQVGYVLKAHYDEFEDELLLRVIDENGEKVTLYSNEKLYYVNGNDTIPAKNRITNKEYAASLINDARKEEFGGGTLILYKLNSKGKILEFELAADYTTDIERTDDLDESGIFRQTTNKIAKINHKTGLFLLSMRIGPETKIFKVPSDISKTDKFSVYTGETNCFEWNTEYSIVGFSKNKNAEYADYVLTFLSGDNASVDENNVFIVQKVHQALNSEDDIVTVIEGKWGTADKEFYLDVDMSSEEINRGDILRLGFDEDENVIAMKKALDIKNPTFGKAGALTDKFFSYFAYVYDFKGNTLRVSTKSPESVTQTTDLINTYTDKMPTIYRFDESRKYLETIDVGSIRPTDKIFAWFYYADHKMMVVYE